MRSFDRQLADRLARAFAAALGRGAEQIDPAVRPAAEAAFGDYQSNAAMPLAKQAGLNPRQLAQQAVAAADLADLCEPPQVAGPGFINLRLKPQAVGAAVRAMAADGRLGVEPADTPETIVVDFSSPNLAKEMHVGHLRSTILGDALVRMLGFLGHKVIRQNHVGDWGTQFGMLLAYMSRLAVEHGVTDYQQLPELKDLEAFYTKAKELFDRDPEFAAISRTYVVQLQKPRGGGLLGTWETFRDLSLEHCQRMYERLGVTLRHDHVRGESAYNDDLPDIVAELDSKGLLRQSEGARCVFLDGFVGKDGRPLPLIVQKTDAGYLYATTDLAAIRYRVRTLGASRILYVTDARQAHHFKYVFAVARAVGFAPDSVQLVHVPFGTIQGPDGRPFKTRAGDTVKLADLLDEAEQRAMRIVEQKNPDLAPDAKAAVARAVGVGAVKYFDLSNNRVSDYRFDFDRMLSLTGNTAPYLQYAYTRVRSIFRKGGLGDEQVAAIDHAPSLAHEMELALAKHLVRYGETIGRVVEDNRPNILCDYLYELAIRFSAFYENCPVLKADEPTRTERLLLCQLAARTLAHGLDLLGIEVLEQM